jgi:ABC-2 type transport system ATP-binding protein
VDPQSRAFLLDTIRELNRDGVTIIYTSHLLDEVQQLCRSAAIIDNGQLLRQGTLQELLHPQEKTSLDIDLDQPPGSDLIAQLQCQLQGEQHLHWPQWQALDELSELLATIAHSGCSVQSIHYGGQSLENLFLTLTSRALRD